jgi:REP element-mobilizing transposase RayT
MTTRPRRPQFAQGGYYHLYNRGAHRQSIFRQEGDYLSVLSRMRESADLYQIAIIAYCLMPNHYHFLVRQDGPHRAGQLAQSIFNGYSKAFNLRYGHTGTLFEGHYQAIRVERDAHLIHLCRYIHANPVKDGFALAPELWPYSNYLEWIGQRNGELVDHGFVAQHFPQPQCYIAFVQDYLSGRQADVA